MRYAAEVLNASHAANWVTYLTGKEYATYNGTFPIYSSVVSDKKVGDLEEMLEECSANDGCAGFTFDPRDKVVLRMHHKVLLDLDRLEPHPSIKTYVNLDRGSESVYSYEEKVS